jgi:hypothetical protein
MIRAVAAKPLERSNTSVDEQLADAGVCGQVHLPTGRTCVEPARHAGGCDFVVRDEVPKRVERHLAAHPAH